MGAFSSELIILLGLPIKRGRNQPPPNAMKEERVNAKNQEKGLPFDFKVARALIQPCTAMKLGRI